MSNDGRLANHNSGSVIDEERPTNLGAGMDVDSRLRVREFRNDPRDDRRSKFVQRMRHAMMNDCPDTRET